MLICRLIELRTCTQLVVRKPSCTSLQGCWKRNARELLKHYVQYDRGQCHLVSGDNLYSCDIIFMKVYIAGAEIWTHCLYIWSAILSHTCMHTHTHTLTQLALGIQPLPPFPEFQHERSGLPPPSLSGDCLRRSHSLAHGGLDSHPEHQGCVR